MTDFEIEAALDCLDIDEDVLIEMAEVFEEEEQLFKDISFEEDFIEQPKLVNLPCLPSIVVVEDEDIPLVVTHPSSDTNIQPECLSRRLESSPETFKCQYCQKKYKHEHLLEVHLKNCKRKPFPSLSRNDYMKNAESYLLSAITDAFEDPIHCICSPGLEVKSIADTLLKLNDKALLDVFGLSISSKMFNIIMLCGFKCSEKEIMLTKFHEICCDIKVHEEWGNLLESYSIPLQKKSKNIILQYILKKYLLYSMKYYNQTMKTLNSNENEQRETESIITKDEEQTIYYVSGYVLRSLINSVKKKRDERCKAVLQLLNAWIRSDEEEKNNEDETSLVDWTERLDRGGLLYVADDFYDFILKIEQAARKVVNRDLLISYCGENLHDIVHDKLVKEEKVLNKWDILTINVANKSLCDLIFNKILRKWTNLRINAFVKAWKQIVKRDKSVLSKKKASRQGEVSLRKDLK